jgi:hypothetical protein
VAEEGKLVKILGIPQPNTIVLLSYDDSFW